MQWPAEHIIPDSSLFVRVDGFQSWVQDRLPRFWLPLRKSRREATVQKQKLIENFRPTFWKNTKMKVLPGTALQGYGMMVSSTRLISECHSPWGFPCR